MLRTDITVGRLVGRQTSLTLQSVLVAMSPVLSNSLFLQQMSSIIRKPAFCIYENKDADQLRNNRAADQCLCSPSIDRTILLLIRNFKPLSIFCGCTARFLSDLVGNPKTGFLESQLKYRLVCRQTSQTLQPY